MSKYFIYTHIIFYNNKINFDKFTTCVNNYFILIIEEYMKYQKYPYD